MLPDGAAATARAIEHHGDDTDTCPTARESEHTPPNDDWSTTNGADEVAVAEAAGVDAAAETATGAAKAPKRDEKRTIDRRFDNPLGRARSPDS